MRRSLLAAALCIALALMSYACNDPARGPAKPRPVVKADSARYANLEPGSLGTVPSARVIGWKGPGDKPFDVTIRTEDPPSALARRFGTVTRRTSLRSRAADLGQFPCTSCHLGRAIVMRDERVKDAHQNIKAVHPVQTGGACSTCHAPDNVELLALKNGERATLDHTYRVCAQCHFAQAKAWAGGGHGKRLDGWEGRRIVMGCADCHDPHKPTIETRIPFRAPHLERVRGNDK
jgi:hypothetical protein